MEQMLLFDDCKNHPLPKRKSTCHHWSYWRNDTECEQCNLELSIKMIKNVRSYCGRREYMRKKGKTFPTVIKIRRSLRSRVRKLIQTSFNQKKFQGKNKLIGCTNQELKQHLESQFKPGMTWENWGSDWHVDHIKPCSLFDVTNPDDLKQINHYTNLQPLWATTKIARQNGDFKSIGNLEKGNKYEKKNNPAICII